MAALLTRLTGRGGPLCPVRLPQLLPTYAIRLLNSFTLADSLGFEISWGIQVQHFRALGAHFGAG